MKNRNERIGEINVRIKKCGIFVDKEYLYSGVTSDVLIGNYGTFKVKCSSSVQNLTSEKGIIEKKNNNNVLDVKEKWKN